MSVISASTPATWSVPSAKPPSTASVPSARDCIMPEQPDSRMVQSRPHSRSGAHLLSRFSFTCPPCLPTATALGLLPSRRCALTAGAGYQQQHRGQSDDGPHAQKGQRDAGGLCCPVVCLHIKAGQHQRRREGIGGEQETALKEQDAVPQEKGQDGAAQIGPPHLAEYQNHGHTDQEGGQSRSHHLSALLENHPPASVREALPASP